MPITLHLLTPDDAHLLDNVAGDVFDDVLLSEPTRAFLADPRHHIIVALDGDLVVGMISAVNHVHPDKPDQLWINEVGVAPTHHRQGIGRQLLERMLAHGREIGCSDAWVGTEESNVAARGLYECVGGESQRFLMYEFSLGSE